MMICKPPSSESSLSASASSRGGGEGARLVCCRGFRGLGFGLALGFGFARGACGRGEGSRLGFRLASRLTRSIGSEEELWRRLR